MNRYTFSALLALAFLSAGCIDGRLDPRAAAALDALDAALCPSLSAILASTSPGAREEVGHVCDAAAPLVQRIVDGLAAAPVTGTGNGIGVRRHRPVRHRGRRIGYMRDDFAERVQVALDAAALPVVDAEGGR